MTNRENASMVTPLRIGLDFDNTIICYDQVFGDLAKAWGYVGADFQGSKQALRDYIQAHHPEGDIAWQRLQGKTYGEFIHQATPFPGLHEFIATAKANRAELYIVSHKTELGHFDEKRINLRDAARQWLHDQGLFAAIPEANVFFATTREEKIARIQSLQCTHFIDDLVEVLGSPLFPTNVERFLFQPQPEEGEPHTLKHYTNWNEIKHVCFPR